MPEKTTHLVPVICEHTGQPIQSCLLINSKRNTAFGVDVSPMHSQMKILEEGVHEARPLESYEGTGVNNTFGLSREVFRVFLKKKGIENLYDWQYECLSRAISAGSSNLVYSLPTSGGKTLVAEILMLRELLLNHKNVLFILPFVSIVQEKVRSLTSVGLALGFWVEEYSGNRGRIPPIKRRGSHSVMIATIEKAHAIVNSMIEKKYLNDIGLVIVDELHMIGDGGPRGACIEMILVKLLCVSPSTRIVGMSATLSNMPDLIRFLHAYLYTSDFRPVQLVEYVKLGEHVYELSPSPGNTTAETGDADLLFDRLVHRRMVDFQYSKAMTSRDPDHLVGLVAEVLMTARDSSGSSLKPEADSTHRQTSSCLVFCPTKVHCESTARMLAELLPPIACFPGLKPKGGVGVPDEVQSLTDRRNRLLDSLRLDAQPDSEANRSDGQPVSTAGNGSSCCPVLQVTVPRGVAYHHSGLTQEERSAIEEAYMSGTLSVICCTSTLAAGVNLPARRVIIRKPMIGSSFLSGSQYQQMTGRAGRAGLDSHGESVTILQPNDCPAFARMLAGIPGAPTAGGDGEGGRQTKGGGCRTSLVYDDGRGLRQLLLSLIGFQLAVTHVDLMTAVNKSLFAVQFHSERKNGPSIQDIVNRQLQALISKDLVVAVSCDAFNVKTVLPASTKRLGEVKDLHRLRFHASQLGRAAIQGGLDSDLIAPLLADLRLAARGLNTAGPLHLLYLVIPSDSVDGSQVDWSVLYHRLADLPSSESGLVGLLGYPEGYPLWKATGQPIRKKRDERPLARLYLALALSDLWRGRTTETTWQVAERYRLSRGTLQSLLQSAASLALSLARALASEFAADSEVWAFAHLLPEFANRLAYCVATELLPIMEIPGVKRARARQLYNAGFCSLKEIACAEPSDLTRRLSPPITRRAASDIVQAARMLVSERADALQQEATDLVSGVSVLAHQPGVGKSVMSQLAEQLRFRPTARWLDQPPGSSYGTSQSHSSANTQDADGAEIDLFA